jgi:hypothetical protein
LLNRFPRAASRGKNPHQQPLLPDMAALVNATALKETVMHHA